MKNQSKRNETNSKLNGYTCILMSLALYAILCVYFVFQICLTDIHSYSYTEYIAKINNLFYLYLSITSVLFITIIFGLMLMRKEKKEYQQDIIKIRKECYLSNMQTEMKMVSLASEMKEFLELILEKRGIEEK